MKVKLVISLLLACAIGVVAVGTAAAKAPKPKKKPVAAKPKFDARFDCQKIAPPSLLTSLAGGFGGTYGLKLPKYDQAGVSQAGLPFVQSICNYTQSDGWPSLANTPDGQGSVVIVYGADAAHEYNKDHAAAVARVKCTGQTSPDPRDCGPVPVSGVGDQAYEATYYIGVLRGKVFLSISLHAVPDADGVGQLPGADMLASMAKALLARTPSM